MTFTRISFTCSILLFATTSIAQWKLAAPNIIASIFRPYIDGGIIVNHNGILWVGYRNIWMSADTGKSWSLRTPFNNFNNSCIKDISFYDDNIGLATTQNGEIYITQDQGLSWVQHIPPNPFRYRPSIESACFAGTANNIIGCSYAGDRYISNDGGITWSISLADSLATQIKPGSGGTAYLMGGYDEKKSDGSHLYETNDFGATWFMHSGLFNWDSYSFERDRCDTSIFYVVNDNLAYRINKTSQVLVSHDVGNSWNISDPQSLPHHCGSISAAENAIFVQTYSGISRSTDQGQTWKDIGGPPNYTDTRFVTAINNNVIVAVDSFGSVWVTYNSGGDSLNYTDEKNIALQTADVQTDTIGGNVAVPISLKGIGSPIDIEMIVHYDPQFIYEGTYSIGNVRLDIPAESWSGRSLIQIPNASSSGILAYSYFNVFNDSSKKTSVTFDSVIFCINYLPTTATSTITPSTACGTDILTRFMRDTIFPDLTVNPNPTSGDISILSSRDLGRVRTIIYNMLGVKCYESIILLNKNTPSKIFLPIINGVYSVHVESLNRTCDLRVIVNR